MFRAGAKPDGNTGEARGGEDFTAGKAELQTGAGKPGEERRPFGGIRRGVDPGRVVFKSLTDQPDSLILLGRIQVEDRFRG